MRVLVLVCLLTGVAHADDSLRCGQRLVSLGSDEHTVLDACGTPASAERHVVHGHTRWGTTRLKLETWTYDFGPGSFVRVLGFEDGVLKTIEPGDYGR